MGRGSVSRSAEKINACILRNIPGLFIPEASNYRKLIFAGISVAAQWAALSPAYPGMGHAPGAIFELNKTIKVSVI
jgi:hypothetical protein